MANKCMFIPCFQDVIFGCKSIKEEVILLVVYNLLGVVEKLHKAEIVHGDLRPEIFFLGDRLGYVYESTFLSLSASFQEMVYNDAVKCI